MYIVFPLTMLSWILFLSGQARIGLAEGIFYQGGGIETASNFIYIKTISIWEKGTISKKIFALTISIYLFE